MARICCSVLLLVTLAGVRPLAAVPDSKNAACNADHCRNFAMLKYYRELGCQPVNKTADCCPTAFDCSFLTPLDDKKCQYKGKVYEVGSVISQEVEDPCALECRCTETLRGVAFECTNIVCPEREVYGQLPENCFLKFNARECCATGFHCIPYGAGEEIVFQQVRKCIYEGREYLEGQYLGIQSPLCKTCVCDKDFDGTLNGHWCHKYQCDMLVYYSVPQIKNCAPVFSEEFSCCPETLYCPSGRDSTISSSNYRTAEEELTCSFGPHLKLLKGDQLLAPEFCVQCKCDVPPFVTCYINNFPGCRYPDHNIHRGQ